VEVVVVEVSHMVPVVVVVAMEVLHMVPDVVVVVENNHKVPMQVPVLA
jgi:hypothetical protein